MRWRPFYLDPTAPKEGASKMDHLIKKFGKARFDSIVPMMAQVGKSCDPPIAFKHGGKTGSTTDSHRLAEWAFKKGGAALQDKLMEEMFKDYFEQERFLGDADVLAAAAARAGVSNEAEARAFLASSDLREEVERDIRAFQAKYRISGVPFFIIDGKYGISGAQEAESFVEIFEELASKQ